MASLETLKKGFLPHRFNVPDCQDYVGPYPIKEYYGVNELLYRYCLSDVLTLRIACLKFRKDFLETVGIDPLARARPVVDVEKIYNDVKDKKFDLQRGLYRHYLSDVLTLRIACLKFRKDFLETIGIDPLARHLTLS